MTVENSASVTIVTMDTRFGKPVPYDKTAIRPRYEELPAVVRADIAARLGGEPVSVNAAGGGFTGGFAGVLTTADGNHMFVKAAGPQTPFVVDAYTREAHFNPALPADVPAPRLRYSAQINDWVVLGMEPVAGKAPRLPFTSHELNLMLTAWEQAAAALTPAPLNLVDLGVRDFALDAGPRFTHFAAAAAGDVEPTWMPVDIHGRLEELAQLEKDVPLALHGDAVVHGDLRPDNVILGEDRAWICDWNFSCIGAPWFDTVSLLITAHGDGHDAERLFWEHTTSRDVSSHQLDAVLAGVAGYYLSNGSRPLIDRVSPYLRQHQRWNGLATLDWLSQRRGW